MSEAEKVEETQLSDQEKVENAENALYGDNTKPDEKSETETEKEPTETETKAETEVDDKADGEKSEESKAEDKDGEQDKEVEYSLKLDEESLLDVSLVEDVKAFAKENKLSNKQAQGVLKGQEKAVTDFWDRQLDIVEKSKEEWRESVINDPQMGGENLKQTAEHARKVVAKFGSEEFVTLLQETGYGDHPEFVRFTSRLGKLMDNDTLIMPGASGKEARTAEDIFYPNQNNRS
jgi:hypothetical protein